jgi:uncharacterized Zn finger protein
MEVKPLSYRVWLVYDGDEEYYVFLTGGKLRCTCPYFNRRPRICKHIEAVMETLVPKDGIKRNEDVLQRQ